MMLVVQKSCFWLVVSVWLQLHVLAPVCQKMNRSRLQSHAVPFPNVLLRNPERLVIDQCVGEAWLIHAKEQEGKEDLGYEYCEVLEEDRQKQGCNTRLS
jgi:hypothetical protein